jgi:hypothetical protein
VVHLVAEHLVAMVAMVLQHIHLGEAQHQLGKMLAELIIMLVAAVVVVGKVMV